MGRKCISTPEYSDKYNRPRGIKKPNRGWFD
jgi:hypothetical protein